MTMSAWSGLISTSLHVPRMLSDITQWVPLLLYVEKPFVKQDFFSPYKKDGINSIESEVSMLWMLDQKSDTLFFLI